MTLARVLRHAGFLFVRPGERSQQSLGDQFSLRLNAVPGASRVKDPTMLKMIQIRRKIIQ
jgi:hypothetical protein